jgi:5-methyltetrahydropteroyltriglutamate--homocysteine methyltransferase
MENRDSRILTTHVGSLVRPQGIIDLMRAKEFGQEYDREELAEKVRSGVAEVVQRQMAEGVDIPSDGEYGKSGFSAYVHDRLAGFEPRPKDPNQIGRAHV